MKTAEFTKKQIRETEKRLREKGLRKLLQTPEGCLKIFKSSIKPGQEYPNAVSQVVRARLKVLLKREQYEKDRGNYIRRYKSLIKEAKEDSQKWGEDFPGEYRPGESTKHSLRERNFFSCSGGEWRD